MPKKLITNYKYLQFLVDKIKLLNKENKDYDWYFEELITIYSPLIQSMTRKAFNKFKSDVSFNEVKSRVIELFFDTILKYEAKYKNTDKVSTDNFDYVYFSNYLKRKLPWDLMRLYKPSKPDYDDFAADPRHVTLDYHKYPEIEHSSYYTSVGDKPISDNFISLCRMVKKELKNELLGEIMLLKFGYDFKNDEIALFLGITPLKVSATLNELKKYWAVNKEYLINE